MTDREDNILEAGLAEVVGKQTPPDLSARILQAAAARFGTQIENDRFASVPALPTSTPAPVVTPAPALLPLPLPQPVALHPAGMNGHSHANGSVANGVKIDGLKIEVAPEARPRPTFIQRTAWLAAAAAAIVVALVGYPQLQEMVAANNKKDESKKPEIKTPIVKGTPDKPEKIEAPQIVERPAPPPAVPNHTIPQPSIKNPIENPIVDTNTKKGANPDAPLTTHVEPRTVPKKSDAEVIALIDRSIREGWLAAGIESSPLASDEEWCRRVFLDIVGRIPSTEEVQFFLRDKSPEKKAHLVDRLLGKDPYSSDRYDVEYARNWTTIWTNQLIGRSGGMDARRPVHREGLQRWLRKGLLNNKPYDKFVAELVSADGSNTPGDADFNGAVNFLLDNVQNHSISATNKVSELFLGTKISCTQCHDHPSNDRKQHAFWELNAFFRQTKARRMSEGAQPDAGVDSADFTTFARLVDDDFPGEGRPNLNEAAIFFERRNGFMKAAYPVFEGDKINPSGYVTLVNRRDELSKRLTKSSALLETAVNRMWAHFFGFGFVMPLDDMGPHNPPSHPALLSMLGEEFQSQGYDSKRLIRWIVLSEAYGLTSRMTEKNSTDDPGKIDGTRGGRLAFSRFYPRQMEAEQVYESLRSVSHGSVREDAEAAPASLVARMSEADQAKAEREKHAWLQQFVLTFETDDNNETSTFDGTIPQTLMMMNGEIVRRATRTDRGSFLAQLAASKAHASSSRKIEEVYRVVLGRKPTAAEQTAAGRLWVANRGDSLVSLQDLSWVLLNSNEFIINH